MWQGDPALTPGYWFRADPKAKWYEEPTYFRSALWDGEFDCNFPVGEDKAGYEWGGSQNAQGYLGINHCGSDAAMSFGGVHGSDPPIPTDANGRAACCARLDQVALPVLGAVPLVRQLWLQAAKQGAPVPAVQGRYYTQEAVALNGCNVDAFQGRAYSQPAVSNSCQCVVTAQTTRGHQLGLVSSCHCVPTVQGLVPRQTALAAGGALVPADQEDDVPVVGELRLFAANIAPVGWLECDGSTVLQSTYAALYGVLGTTWGPAVGGMFTLPGFARRAPMGRGGSATAVIGNAIGDVGGEENHILTTGELASHVHQAMDAGGGNFIGYAGSGGPAGATVNTGLTLASNPKALSGATGGSGGHNTIQPSAIIKVMIFAGV